MQLFGCLVVVYWLKPLVSKIIIYYSIHYSTITVQKSVPEGLWMPSSLETLCCDIFIGGTLVIVVEYEIE